MGGWVGGWVGLEGWACNAAHEQGIMPAWLARCMAVWLAVQRLPPSHAAAGIRPSNLREAAAFEEVQAQVSELLKGRILVGHAIENDLEVRAGPGLGGRLHPLWLAFPMFGKPSIISSLH